MKRKVDSHSDIENVNESGNESEEIKGAESEKSDPNANTSTDSVEKLEADLTAANDKYLRLYSEFENYKRRVSKDRIEQSRMAGSEIMTALLPVIDDLERALKSAENSKGNDSVLEGVKLIYSKIKSAMAAKGLKEMESVGEKFDSEIHDAIANVPTDDDKKGTVIEEVEKGYYLNERVIRHAKVIVGN